MLADDGEVARINLRKNDELLCRMEGDNSENGAADYDTGTCAATVMLNAGNSGLSSKSGNCVQLFFPFIDCNEINFLNVEKPTRYIMKKQDCVLLFCDSTI